MFVVLVAYVEDVVAYMGWIWGHRESTDACLFRLKVEACIVGRVEAMHCPGLG